MYIYHYVCMNTTLQIGYLTLALEYVQTREQWLERTAAIIRESLIPQLTGHRCRISCGWPHKARSPGRPEG
jgi:hypothetical protein